ncbi:MAG: hypothetical protein L0Y62_07700 [Nitrospirae bacterium]|nr:hypothetical protein [Nitrospirota bacterium]
MQPLLELFTKFVVEQDIAADTFIVGGAVRDLLKDGYTHSIWGCGLKDIDIVVNGDAISVAKGFADYAEASFVLLDREFGIARVVKKDRFMDISSLRGESIYDDLSERDLTINAMAVPVLEANCQMPDIKDKVIDPFNGQGDLSNGIIRMVSEQGLLSDPLRLLRIYRFALTLNFKIDDETMKSSKKLAPYIQTVAVERIADELRHILKTSVSSNAIEMMIENEVLYFAIPELRDTGRDILHLYRKTEEILNNPYPYFQNYSDKFKEYFSEDYKTVCLKFLMLLGATDAAVKAANRLKMSGKEVNLIGQLISNLRCLSDLCKGENGLLINGNVIKLLRELRDGIYPLSVLAISYSLICDQPFNPSSCYEIVKFYNEDFIRRANLLPLITGDDLINVFGLKPSHLIGEMLFKIEGMTLNGELSTREEAFKVVKKILKAA